MLNETEKLYEEVKALYEKGIKLFYEKKYDEAKKVLSSLIESYPRHSEFRERAQVFLRIIEKLQQQEPSGGGFQDMLNEIISALNEKDPEFALEKLKELEEKDARVYYLQALAYAMMEREQEALENLKKAVELEPRFRVLAKKEPDFMQMREKGLLDNL